MLQAPAATASKAEIMQYLRDSFAFARKATSTITPQNALTPVRRAPNAFAGTNLQLAVFGCSHGADIYGQLVEYLRMNGIVPPASEPARSRPARRWTWGCQSRPGRAEHASTSGPLTSGFAIVARRHERKSLGASVLAREDVLTHAIASRSGNTVNDSPGGITDVTNGAPRRTCHAPHTVRTLRGLGFWIHSATASEAFCDDRTAAFTATLS
jgi:hypothetical protein